MHQRSAIRSDYKPDPAGRRGARSHQYALVAVALSAVGLASVFGLQAALPGNSESKLALTLDLPEPTDGLIDVLLLPYDDEAEVADDAQTTQVTVNSGDSLALIFRRVGLTPADVHAVVNASDETRRLNNLRPGQQFAVTRGADGRLLKLEFAIDPAQTLLVVRNGDGYDAELLEHPLERRIAFAEGVVTTSLFAAAQRAGMSDTLTGNLARIFGWDIDFVLDIREGDRFSVLYEELYRDGEKVRDGAILAARFVNRGRTFQTVRFVGDDGRADHYTPEGRAMRRAFIRAPVDFTRISSQFNPNRRHPVLNTIRAHRGVDYAAPTGTPVYAAGDGRVIRRGPYGGYGNAVEIQHGGNITTLYAHLSRFQRGVVNGTRVRQGQVIGYVGMTGLATGPHLHYEFRLNGVHRNPLTVRLPDAEPLPARYRERFETYAMPLLAHLDALSEGEPRLAARPTTPDAG